jgi:hypothetical protein
MINSEINDDAYRDEDSYAQYLTTAENFRFPDPSGCAAHQSPKATF